MSEYIELIAELKPVNNQAFAIADVNDLRGGYIQVDTINQMNSFIGTNKLKEGMLCYVKDSIDFNMFQFKIDRWIPWTNDSKNSFIKVVELMTDLDDINIKIKGQLVYINEINELRYYNGLSWNSFSKLYIQNDPPADKGGIWIDTSEKREHLTSNNVIQEMLSVINILNNRVKDLEYLVKEQLDFGDFQNNKINQFNKKIQLDPSTNAYDKNTSEVQDDATQKENIAQGYVEKIPDPTLFAKHLCIKSGTYSEMLANKSAFSAKELLFCYDKNQLYIKNPKTFELVQIGSGTINPPITDEMEGIITEIIGTGGSAKTKIVGIEMTDIANKDNSYLIQIQDGQFQVLDQRLDKSNLAGNTQVASVGDYFNSQYFPIIPANVGSVDSPKIYVNSVYCGKNGDEYSYNPVSHNYVELCNLGMTDLNMKGLFLHYTQKSTGEWVTIPLKGVLKAQGTYLIRGAQCSVLNTNTTLITIDAFDIEWKKKDTYNNTRLDIDESIEAGIKAETIWDKSGLIKFDDACSFMITGAESLEFFKTNIMRTSAPWDKANGVIKWYVDCIGIGKFNDKIMPSEATSFPNYGNNILLMRYFNMDPVKQATKALSARSNAKDWTYIDLDKVNPLISIADYIPKASFQNKNIFFDKTLLKEGIPNIITCSFGYNAHKTRCFTWVSKGYYNEYLKFWKSEANESTAITIESFKSGDNRAAINNRNNAIYDRIRGISTDGTAFTVHKLIIDLEEPVDIQKYFYRVGREGYYSDIRSFTMRNRAKVIADGFDYMQFSDQQGFNNEEYEMARVSDEFINDSTDKFDFILNVGDITQNGNRINEWISYFNAGDELFKNKEQMFTIGNNDLCPVDVHILGYGDDKDKTNPINAQYFFTVEHPYTIPTSNAGVYIPCVYSFIYGNTYFLSVNSEITELARTDVFLDDGTQNVYDKVKAWCESDLLQLDNTIEWKIAYCHESPFTIITADLIMSYVKDGVADSGIKRGGSHLNTVGNYFLSLFLQANNFKLCMCGHKHTYSNTRLLREDPLKTMQPIVYEPLLAEAPWYKLLPAREKLCCQLSNDKTVNYVKYAMTQACGFKLASNKELPAKNIPWLLEYYPVIKQDENPSTNKATVTVNPEQQYPNYIIWNIGKGVETEVPGTNITIRDRILGHSFKLKKTGSTKSWAYKYNTPVLYTQLNKAGGNGSQNPDNNIIIEKTL